MIAFLKGDLSDQELWMRFFEGKLAGPQQSALGTQHSAFSCIHPLRL